MTTDALLPIGTPVLIVGFEPIKGYGEYNIFWSEPERVRAGRLAEAYQVGSAFLLKEGVLAGSIGPRDARVAPMQLKSGARFFLVQRRTPDEHGCNLYFVLEDKNLVVADLEAAQERAPHRLAPLIKLVKYQVEQAYLERGDDVHNVLNGL